MVSLGKNMVAGETGIDTYRSYAIFVSQSSAESKHKRSFAVPRQTEFC